MKLKIFTEAGESIGFGHISRCSALMDEAIMRNIDSRLIVYGDIQARQFSTRNTVTKNWLTEEYLKDFIVDTDYCIVDSYLADKSLYAFISEKSQKALFIDDTARIEYPKGIIVNPALKVDSLMYVYSGINEYLLGAKYIILRSPFISKRRIAINEEVKEVLITMGGTDIRSIIPSIITNICAEHPEIIFNIISGNKESLCSVNVNHANVKVFVEVGARKMSELMLRSDLAITAAGQTIYELLATGTPFIAIKVADNQDNNVRGMKEISNEQIAIEYDDGHMMEKLNRAFSFMLSCNRRENFNKSYRNCIDGLGSARIIDRLLSQ